MVLIRSATVADVSYIVSLHKRLGEYLGLVPMGTYESRLHHLKIAEENGDPIGFGYAGERSGILTLHQVGVQDDARRLSVGSALVDSFIGGSVASLARCRVRDTIPDRDFWPAIGFVESNRVEAGKKRGKELIVYRRDLQPTLFEHL